jgi:hypothetical protein
MARYTIRESKLEAAVNLALGAAPSQGIGVAAPAVPTRNAGDGGGERYYRTPTDQTNGVMVYRILLHNQRDVGEHLVNNGSI